MILATFAVVLELQTKGLKAGYHQPSLLSHLWFLLKVDSSVADAPVALAHALKKMSNYSI